LSEEPRGYIAYEEEFKGNTIGLQKCKNGWFVWIDDEKLDKLKKGALDDALAYARWWVSMHDGEPG